MAAQSAGFLHRPDQWETGTRADGGPPGGEGGNCVFLSPQAFPFLQGSTISVPLFCYLFFLFGFSE